MPYRILNWDKYQARRDGHSCPWVKLHKKLLDSVEFYSIPAERRWEWPALMLISDDHSGVISGTDRQIGFRLYREHRDFDPTPFLSVFIEFVPVGHQLDRVGHLDEEREESKKKNRSKNEIDRSTDSPFVQELRAVRDQAQQTPADARDRFVVEVMALGDAPHYTEWWRQVYANCVRAGDAALMAAWGALMEAQKRGSGLGGAYVASAIKKAGVRLPPQPKRVGVA